MAAIRHGIVRGALVIALAGTLPAAGMMAAHADLVGSWKDSGSRLNFKDRLELKQIKAEAAAANGKKGAPRFEYASVANCGTNTPDSTDPDDLCRAAALACAGNTPEQGLGPSVRLFRRAVNAAGVATGGWQQYGTTCFPEEAPGPARPAVTMAMVLAAFHDTAFARAQLEVQPRGNVTLVRLPTYFEARWPQAGFAPGEVDRVDPARMAGFAVEIRPVAKSLTYVYGDGSTSGPTTSTGGPYPGGDITRTYTRAGTFAVRVDVTYGGQFRVSRGEWIDIPGTVTIRGTSEDLSVRTAQARLVTR
jgi:hypothetical protein